MSAKKLQKSFPRLLTPPRPTHKMRASFGAIAQLVERLHGMQEVSGSTPLSSTRFIGELPESRTRNIERCGAVTDLKDSSKQDGLVPIV